MKKIFSVLSLILIFTLMLTSCSIDPAPKIKEGRFNFSVTYEEWGETKTVSGVFVCKYAGRSFILEGGRFTRDWEGHVEGIDHADEIYKSMEQGKRAPKLLQKHIRRLYRNAGA